MSSPRAFYIVIIWLFCSEHLVIGIDEDSVRAVSPQPQQKSCKTVFQEINRQQMQQIRICSDKLGYKTGQEKVRHQSCILKCVMINGGLLNPDGSALKDNFSKYILEHFPASMHTKAQQSFAPCLNRIGAYAVQNGANDKQCKAHEPFIKCMTTNFLKLCQK